MTKRGFTYIELLIAVGIMLMLVGGGIAAYIRFNDRQALLGASKELQSYMRSAQVKARTGDRRAGCTRLEGYAVRMVLDSSQVSLVAVCEGGEVVKNTYQLDNTVKANSAVDMQFLVLHGGVNGAGTVTLQSNFGSYQFDVTAGGEIQEGGFQ